MPEKPPTLLLKNQRTLKNSNREGCREASIESKVGVKALPKPRQMCHIYAKDDNMNETVAGKRRTTVSITLTALFAALIAAGTFISIPLPFTPVPVVMQNLFSLLAGLVLGPMLGAASVALYLIAGLIGAPVYAGATSGIARLLGPTGGFLFGYLLSAFVAGLLSGRPR
jgi:hypothetical protein